MTISGKSDYFELSDYLGMLRRRWWIWLALAGIGVLLAGAYFKSAPRTYIATSSVYVSATAANNNQTLGRTGGPVNMDNEAQIVQSQTVAALAGRRLHSALPPQVLVKQVSVTVPPNTTVLNINCKAPAPAAAALCANDFASAYLSVRLADAANTISSALSALQAQVTALTTRISQLKTQLANLRSDSAAHITTQLKLNGANSQLAEIENQINLLVPELSSLQEPHNTLAGHVITPAVPPSSPSSPRALLLLPSGLIAGLLAGLAAAFVVERRDDRVHSPRDVERFLDLPVLLSIKARRSRANPALASPGSRLGRAFAELAQYSAASLGDGNHVLLVAGTSAGNGASVIAANLAVMLARTRSEVVLIRGNQRETAAGQLLGVGDGRGLTEVLTGSATVLEVARRSPEIPRLRVITPGLNTAAPLSGMRYDSTRRMLDDLRADARYVVIEANAVGGGADAFIFAEFADGAIVAIEVARTRRRDAADCLRRLGRLQTTVLGAAVVPASGRRRRDRPLPGADEATAPSRAVTLKARSIPVPERSRQNGSPQPHGTEKHSAETHKAETHKAETHSAETHGRDSADRPAQEEPAGAGLKPGKDPADSTTGA